MSTNYPAEIGGRNQSGWRKWRTWSGLEAFKAEPGLCLSLLGHTVLPGGILVLMLMRSDPETRDGIVVEVVPERQFTQFLESAENGAEREPNRQTPSSAPNDQASRAPKMFSAASDRPARRLLSRPLEDLGDVEDLRPWRLREGPPTRPKGNVEGKDSEVATNIQVRPPHPKTATTVVFNSTNLDLIDFEKNGTFRPLMRFLQQDSLFQAQLADGRGSPTSPNLGIEPRFRHVRRTDGTSIGGLFFGDSSRVQENQVGYVNFQTPGEEPIRLKTRFGGSTYEASDPFFNSLRSKTTAEERRAARFAQTGYGSGGAALARLEADVISLGNFKTMLFAEGAYVSRFFEDVQFSEKSRRKETREDVFSSPNRQSHKYGLGFRNGDFGLLVAHNSVSNLSNRAGDFYRAQSFETKASLAMRDLLGDYMSIATLVPSSVFVGYNQSHTREDLTVSRLSPAMTIDGGLYWNWGNMHAGLSGWQSIRSDQPHSANRNALFRGKGADFILGLSDGNWSLNTYVSVSRSEQHSSWNSSEDYNLDGGISLSRSSERLPRVIIALSATS